MKTDKTILESHTIGPWQAKKLCYVEHDAWVILWPDKGGKHMRRVDNDGAFAESDAKIIAVMPELLEVAIQINALSIHGDAHQRLREILKKIRADDDD